MSGSLNCSLASHSNQMLIKTADNQNNYVINLTQSSEDHVKSAGINMTGTKYSDTMFVTTDNSTGDHTNDDSYYYNYDDSMSNIPLEEILPNALGYGIMLLLGMVGNLLVITSVARYRRMHNVTNIFFLSLASADLLLITVCVPVKFSRFFTFTWEYGETVCKAVHYFQNLTIICSVLNLSGLSLERYYAILHPMRAKYMCTVTMARRSVLLIWALSVVMAVPILIGQRHQLVGEVRKGYWCVEDWGSPVASKVYNSYMFGLVFVVPLCLMACAYTSICRRLWQVKYQHCTLRVAHNYVRPDTPSHSPQETNNGRAVLRCYMPIYGRRMGSVNEDYTRKQVVKMLVLVVVLFVVCWGPIMLNNLLVAFDVLHSLHHGYLKPMRQSFWLMAYINSCLNPVVYGFMSKNFRESFRNTVRMCAWGSSSRDTARHRAMWRCSFQAQIGLQVANRSPTVYDRSVTEHNQENGESRPSMSSQWSSQVTHFQKSNGNLGLILMPD